MRKAHLRLFPLGNSHLHHRRHLPRLPCPALASPSAQSRRLPPCRHLPDALPTPPQTRKALSPATAPLPLLQPQAAEHASAAPLLQAPVTGHGKRQKTIRRYSRKGKREANPRQVSHDSRPVCRLCCHGSAKTRAQGAGGHGNNRPAKRQAPSRRTRPRCSWLMPSIFLQAAHTTLPRAASPA